MNHARYAQALVNHCVKVGILAKPDRCESCGKQATGRGLHGHHHRGYSPQHALDVQWLCVACHIRTQHEEAPVTLRFDVDGAVNQCRASTKYGRRCRKSRGSHATLCCFHRMRAAAELHE